MTPRFEDCGIINELLSQVRIKRLQKRFCVIRLSETEDLDQDVVHSICCAIGDGNDLNILDKTRRFPVRNALFLNDLRIFNTMIKHGADSSFSTNNTHSLLCDYTSSLRGRFILRLYTLKPLAYMIRRGADIHNACAACLVYGGRYSAIHSTYKGIPLLPKQMLNNHITRVRAVKEFFDSYNVCGDVGILIRKIGGECVKCIGK